MLIAPIFFLGKTESILGELSQMPVLSPPDSPLPWQSAISCPSSHDRHSVYISATALASSSVHVSPACHQTGSGMKMGSFLISAFLTLEQLGLVGDNSWLEISNRGRLKTWTGEAMCSRCSKASIHITCHFSPTPIMQNQ